MKKSNTWFHHVKGYDDDDDGEDDYGSDDESEVDDLVPGCGQPQALQPLLLPQQIIFNLEQRPILKVDMKIKLKPCLILSRAQRVVFFSILGGFGCGIEEETRPNGLDRSAS